MRSIIMLNCVFCIHLWFICCDNSFWFPSPQWVFRRQPYCPISTLLHPVIYRVRASGPCIHIYAHTYICKHKFMDTSVQYTCISTHTYIDTYIHAYIHTYLCINMHTCTHACNMHAYTHVCIHTYIDAYITTYMYTYICAHTYAHTYAYIYIQAHIHVMYMHAYMYVHMLILT